MMKQPATLKTENISWVDRANALFEPLPNEQGVRLSQDLVYRVEQMRHAILYDVMFAGWTDDMIDATEILRSRIESLEAAYPFYLVEAK